MLNTGDSSNGILIIMQFAIYVVRHDNEMAVCFSDMVELGESQGDRP